MPAVAYLSYSLAVPSDGASGVPLVPACGSAVPVVPSHCHVFDGCFELQDSSLKQASSHLDLGEVELDFLV